MLRLTAIAIGVVTLSPAQSWAQVTVTHFTVTETPTFVNPPDRLLQTGPITHLFGLHNINALTDFTGSEADKTKVVGADGMGFHEGIDGVGHVQFSPEGVPIHGAFAGKTMILPGDGVDGHWDCLAHGTFSDGNFEGQLRCQGMGDLERQQLSATVFNDHWDGGIHVPSAAAVAAVPEPSAATLAVLASLGLLVGSRARGSHSKRHARVVLDGRGCAAPRFI